MIFKNRQEAGQKLSAQLQDYKGAAETLVLALPRGGVVVGFVIAQQLNLPLDIVVPRKIGAPENQEYAIGAITADGQGIFDEQAIKALKIKPAYLKKKIATEKKEAQRRLQQYRLNRSPLTIKNKTIILVDDGIATGLTMRAAIKSVKTMGAKKIIVAVPVAAKDSLDFIANQVDNIICLDTPIFFGAVGAFYENFGQTEDKEVIALMAKAQKFAH